MIRKKNILTVILSILITLSIITTYCFSEYAFADDVSYDYTLSVGEVSGLKGDTVNVPVSINTGETVTLMSGGLKFSYSSDLTYEGYENKGFNGTILESDNAEGSVVSLTMASIKDTAYMGTLLYLKFKISDDAKAGSSLNINFDEANLFSSENQYTINAVSGKVNVESSPVTIKTDSIEVTSDMAGSEVSVPVSISNNCGFSSLQIKFDYSDELTFISETDGLISVYTSEASDAVGVSYASSMDCTEDGVLFYLVFELSPNISASDVLNIDMTVVSFADNNNNDIAYVSESGDINVVSSETDSTEETEATEVTETETEKAETPVLSIGNVKGAVGQEISVPINITHSPGFVSYGLSINFDSEKMEYVRCDAGISSCFDTSNGNIVALTCAMGTAVKGDGIICSLVFNLKDGCSPDDVLDITVNSNTFTDGNQVNFDCIIENGSVTCTSEPVTETETVPDIIVTVGDTSIDYNDARSILIPVSIGMNAGFESAEMGIKFDSNLTFNDIIDGIISPTYDYRTDGNLGVTFASSDIISENGTLFYIKLTLPSNLTSDTTYYININYIELFDENGNMLSTKIQNGVLNVKNTVVQTTTVKTTKATTTTTTTTTNTEITTVQTTTSTTVNTNENKIYINDMQFDNESVGSSIDIPVSIKNNTGFSSFGFRITYPDYLELSDVSGGIISSFEFYNNTTKVAITGSSSDDISSDGVLFTLNFKILTLDEDKTISLDMSTPLYSDSKGNDLYNSISIGNLNISKAVAETEVSTSAVTTTTTELTTTTTTTTTEVVNPYKQYFDSLPDVITETEGTVISLATDSTELQYLSTDNTTVSVDENYSIHLLKEGYALIIVVAPNGTSKYISVTSVADPNATEAPTEITTTSTSTTSTTEITTTTYTTTTTIVTTVETESTTETESDELDDKYIGDLNKDGEVNSKDATIVLIEYANSLTGKPYTVEIYYGDVNRDEKIDSKDAVMMLQFYANRLAGVIKIPFYEYLSISE